MFSSPLLAHTGKNSNTRITALAKNGYCKIVSFTSSQLNQITSRNPTKTYRLHPPRPHPRRSHRLRPIHDKPAARPQIIIPRLLSSLRRTRRDQQPRIPRARRRRFRKPARAIRRTRRRCATDAACACCAQRTARYVSGVVGLAACTGRAAEAGCADVAAVVVAAGAGVVGLPAEEVVVRSWCGLGLRWWVLLLVVWCGYFLSGFLGSTRDVVVGD